MSDCTIYVSLSSSIITLTISYRMVHLSYEIILRILVNILYRSGLKVVLDISGKLEKSNYKSNYNTLVIFLSLEYEREVMECMYLEKKSLMNWLE